MLQNRPQLSVHDKTITLKISLLSLHYKIILSVQMKRGDQVAHDHDPVQNMTKLKEFPNSYISSEKLQNTFPLIFQPNYT